MFKNLNFRFSSSVNRNNMVSFAAAAALAKANYIDRSSTLLFDKIKMSTQNDDIVDDDEEEEEETIIDVDKVSIFSLLFQKSEPFC